MIAERLCRAGVGHLRIVDRDWVELSNLQRQTLFNEADAQAATPKSVAAANHLLRINSDCQIDCVIDDVTHENIESLAANVDLICDGTDNFETRYLINDLSVQKNIPWIHGGCLGASGQVLSVIPGQTACFRCLLPDPPSRDSLETCDTAGVLGPAIGIIASFQAAEALKILSNNRGSVAGNLICIDSWNTSLRTVELARQANCPTCGKGLFPFLSGKIRSATTILCGKNAVQVQSQALPEEGLRRLAEKLKSVAEVTLNAYFMRVSADPYRITVFASGRTIVEGTTEIGEAKKAIAQIIGS
jgi:adenylyltransferase/sulfurtransferase